MSAPEDGHRQRSERIFPPTSWSAIRHAQDPASPEYDRHLRRLVETYWRPIYLVIRHGWTRDDEEAKDLTQEFFARVVLDRALVRSFVPERGSFRAFLRTAIGNFMLNVRRDAGREKRGGGVNVVSIDAAGSLLAETIPDAGALSPEQIFDVSWNQIVMAQALAMLERRLTDEGKGVAFQIFERYDLDLERKELSYAALGEELGLSPAKVKHALLHARATLREVVTEVVRSYVDGPEDLAEELRALYGG